VPPRKDGFGAVNLKQDLLKTVHDYVDSDEGKAKGFRSIADFVDKAVREGLEKQKPKYGHANVYEDHASIIDYDLRGEVNVYFREEGTAWCELHESTNCGHVEYALTLSDVLDAMKKKGWKRRNG
jgi:hypothetical protein